MFVEKSKFYSPSTWMTQMPMATTQITPWHSTGTSTRCLFRSSTRTETATMINARVLFQGTWSQSIWWVLFDQNRVGSKIPSRFCFLWKWKVLPWQVFHWYLLLKLGFQLHLGWTKLCRSRLVYRWLELELIEMMNLCIWFRRKWSNHHDTFDDRCYLYWWV